MAKRRRKLLEILFGKKGSAQQIKKEQPEAEKESPKENVIDPSGLTGDRLVDLIGGTVLMSAAILRKSGPSDYPSVCFGYYISFRNCSMNVSYARFMTREVLEHLKLYSPAKKYMEGIDGLSRDDLEEGIKRAAVKYRDQIDSFWEYHQEVCATQLKLRRHREETAIQQSARATKQGTKKKWL